MSSIMRLKIKFIFDICISLILLLIVVGPMLLLIVFLSIYYRGNPFYIPTRSGYKGKVFRQYKLKSMNNRVDNNGDLLPDHQRITKVGEFLRKTSIDELPQLINVLKGDISIVGPRPLTQEYVKLYTADEVRRLDMKPGITGWAQVNGRNNIDWKRKFQLDIEYIQNHTISKDIKIIFLTIKVALKREGISQEGFVSAERYKG